MLYEIRQRLVWPCWYCFGFVVVLLYHIYKVYLGSFEIVIWNYLVGGHLCVWFAMLFLVGFF